MKAAQATTEAEIRWLIRRDMPSVLRIEQQVSADPWDEAEFLKHLRGGNYIGLVVERDTAVLGFVLYELRKSHLHILRLAIDSAHHRQGLGSQVLGFLKDKLIQQRRRGITASVPEESLRTQLFFRKNLFIGRMQDAETIHFLYQLHPENRELTV